MKINIDPKIVNDAMHKAPFDKDNYRMARAAIKCIEEYFNTQNKSDKQLQFALQFIQEEANEDCVYKDNCPEFVKSNHYTCRPCRAKRFIEHINKV
jgi:hypothetical protein